MKYSFITYIYEFKKRLISLTKWHLFDHILVRLTAPTYLNLFDLSSLLEWTFYYMQAMLFDATTDCKSHATISIKVNILDRIIWWKIHTLGNFSVQHQTRDSSLEWGRYNDSGFRGPPTPTGLCGFNRWWSMTTGHML